ncbi:MAG: ATP-binding protein [Kofleriaceae bacterium]
MSPYAQQIVGSKIRLLNVEDSTDDVELVHRELRKAGYELEWERVDNAEAFKEAIERVAWDVILADFNMPKFSAPAALEILHATGKDIPFIIVSGSVGEAVAVQAMKAGAHDFFSKLHLARLGAAIDREIREAKVRRERHQAVVQLRGAEERYRLMVENIRDYAVFMLDAGGNVLSWNPGAERLVGYAESEILGQPIDRFFVPEDRAQGVPHEALRGAAEHGSHLGEGLRLRRDGSRFWALCTLDRIGSAEALIGFSAIVRDVTEKKQLLDDLQQAVRARDEFLSIASHELKTPLTTMELQLESLKKLQQQTVDARLSDPKVAKKIDTIQRQSERLTVLVDNLLDVTRITSGRLDLRPERVDLDEIIEAVLARMRDTIQRAGCVVEVKSGGRIEGYWDRFRLETVIANLMSNAIKYGACHPIEVITEIDDGFARLHVRDHGIGISPEQQTRIFERFERAVPEQHYGGFGLGLWIVGQIVEAHRGTVRVESSLGNGSAFTVELPRAVEELA